MKRILLCFFIALIFPRVLTGQVAGEGIFNFLQLTSSARTAALGGVQIALPDPDPELLLQNPALLTLKMNNTLSVNYAQYLAGIGFGYGVYAKDLGKLGMAAIGIQFADYGQFVAADETGLITGTFNASDYALTLTYAKSIGNLFAVGATIKPIYSHLENYRSFGMAADFGIARLTTDRLTTFALCIKNIGTQITTYYGSGSTERLAWSLQLGCTHQLQYAPLRFSITAYDLNRWKAGVASLDPNGKMQWSNEASPFSLVMRHISVGAEIFPENKVTLRFGYNYRRHADLSIPDQTGFTGVTTGLGINLTSVRFNYALSGYALSGMVHNFSLSANLSSFTRKK